ncbi:MAG: hypothetical protein KIS73_05535 [Enhydrobacter sp.]|nr:hypothetical protein [Enhydrobacter sp.]
MTASSDKKNGADVLSGEEEITLRRVAYGESPVHTLRAADLAQLRALRLIEDGKDGPILTVRGKAHHAGLPRALGAGRHKHHDDLLGALGKALRDVKR